MHFISLGKLFQSIGAKCRKALFPFEVLMRDGDKEGARLPLIKGSSLNNTSKHTCKHTSKHTGTMQSEN